MKSQKELKELYMGVICAEVWKGEDMRAYAKKKCAYVVELSNGDIISLDKPSIETSFCYGMGMHGTYTDDEFKEAEKMADRARRDCEYFKHKNLAEIDEQIEALRECLRGSRECYTRIHYTGQPEKSILKAYEVVHICDNPEYAPGRWYNLNGVQKLGGDDIQRIIDGLLEVRKAFEKRLDTYLKRYGLKKLKVWTYCVD